MERRHRRHQARGSRPRLQVPRRLERRAVGDQTRVQGGATGRRRQGRRAARRRAQGRGGHETQLRKRG